MRKIDNIDFLSLYKIRKKTDRIPIYSVHREKVSGKWGWLCKKELPKTRGNSLKPTVEWVEEGEFLHKFKGFHGFTKLHRSSFSYWFSHWCAFQMLALVLGRWKFKYLFHDFEKPWLKLIFPYKKIQGWHRRYNRHHLEYGLRNGWDKVDWEALIIDWECSHYTKKEAQLDAYETMERELRGKWKEYKEEIAPRFYNKLKELEL